MSIDTSTPETLARRWGRVIAEKRRFMGLNQAELADLAETSQQNISRIELGSQAPSDELRVRIARAFTMKVSDVFTYGRGDE